MKGNEIDLYNSNVTKEDIHINFNILSILLYFCIKLKFTLYVQFPLQIFNAYFALVYIVYKIKSRGISMPDACNLMNLNPV